MASIVTTSLPPHFPFVKNQFYTILQILYAATISFSGEELCIRTRHCEERRRRDEVLTPEASGLIRIPLTVLGIDGVDDKDEAIYKHGDCFVLDIDNVNIEGSQ